MEKGSREAKSSNGVGKQPETQAFREPHRQQRANVEPWWIEDRCPAQWPGHACSVQANLIAGLGLQLGAKQMAKVIF